jgi:transglutaminase-like putative cysteine protease
LEEYLCSTEFLDIDHPSIQAFVREIASPTNDPRENVIALHNTVRDRIAYNPYVLTTNRLDARASETLKRGEGHCIGKASVLASAARAIGVPSRLGFADVVNHLQTERFHDLVGSNLLRFHGYAEVYLDNQWLKVTPAFDQTLCERMGVSVLTFDGHSDSIFQEFTPNGTRHMQYVTDHGTFADLPFELFHDVASEYYSDLIKAGGSLRGET